MRHVNYCEWADYLERLFGKAGLAVEEVVDISCGTGNMFLELVARGYSVCGFDSSVDMVRLARAKVAAGGLVPQVWVGAMQEFSCATLVDAVLCTYDSLNYCQSLDRVRPVFDNAAMALRKGGVFIFDLSTRHNSKRNFQNYYCKDETPEYKYIRQSYYKSRERIQVNEFLLWQRAPASRTFRELHEQRIYAIDEVISTIPSSLFEVRGVFDGFTLRDGTERSDRVHFLLQRV